MIRIGDAKRFLSAPLAALSLCLLATAAASPGVEVTVDPQFGAELPRAPRKDGTFRNLDPDFRRGPFDLAALPIGSYTPRIIAKPVHMSPEEALQAWRDLRATDFIGVHWGTFKLAREPYDEPPRRIAAEVARLEIDRSKIWLPKPGETLNW